VKRKKKSENEIDGRLDWKRLIAVLK